MTTYNTRNPLGSSHPKDLFDNAENLDRAVNGTEKTWTDRRGVVRKSFKGLEQDMATLLENSWNVSANTLTQLNAITHPRAGSGGLVLNDPVEGNNGWYRKIGVSGEGGWERLANQPVSDASLFKPSTRNLFDPSKIVSGEGFSQAQEKIVVTPAYRRSPYIPIVAGQTYVLSGNQSTAGHIAFFANASDIEPISWSISPSRAATAPEGASFAVFNVTTEGGNVTAYDGTTQFERGSVATAHVPYKQAIPQDLVEGLQADLAAAYGYADEASAAAVRDGVLTSTGKNLFDKSSVVTGEGFSQTQEKIVATSAYRRSPYIPVVAGQTYTLSGNQGGARHIAFFAAEGDVEPISWSADLSRSATAPAGARFAVFNVTTEGGGVTAYDGTTQFERGSVATAYEPYRREIPKSLVSGLDQTVDRSDVFDESSFNLINPAAVDFVNRYSTAGKAMVVDSLGLAATEYIPVQEGEFYTLSGDGIFGLPLNPLNCQGGYFSSAFATAAISNITFVAPVTGVGAVFQVPIGLGITHVVISLRKLNNSAAETSLHGPVQMQKGEVPTAYRPYQLETTIKTALLPAAPGGGSSEGFNAAAWYKFTEGDEGAALSDKFPIFRSHWLLKNKDLCVVNVGTSLTARSTEHCTERTDATRRPPLLHSNNLASILWDRMRWDWQEYRRYDDPGFFTESGGVFSTSFNLPEWDDGAYRNGLTRYSGTTGAAVSFAVPVGAWQFNFIYRTDTTGVETNTIAVTEGNGKIEVFNGTAWVEANGYTFSMREALPVSRVVSIPRADTNMFVDATIPSKSNTTYQKRLKMRCKGDSIDSRASPKSVTITGQTAGRFMYWGVEWSIREFMITYINAARGSHNTRAEGSNGLPRYADNEVWGFKPDLMLFELPIHNDGAAAADSRAGGYWWRLTNNYVFNEDYELSMVTRSAHFGLSPELAMHTSSVAYLFGGIDEDGKLILGEQGDGSMMSALDKFNQAFEWVKDAHPEVAMVNSAKRWVDAGVAIFGDMRSATQGSGKDGATFTNEGGHWNDTGCKIIGKTLTPLLSFTH